MIPLLTQLILADPQGQVSDAWGLTALVVTAIVAPLLLYWLNRRDSKKNTQPTLHRIEAHTEQVGNGFAIDVINKLGEVQRVVNEVHDKVDDVADEQAYQRGRLDQHNEEHKRTPPASS